jgi:hypothetical protein
MTLEAYRADGGVAVDDAAAQEAWSRAARPVLTQISRRYGSLTAPDDLAEAVQVLSGVRTRELPELWLGEVLDAVDIECVARKEPLLSAFCIGPDGRVGERYEHRAASLDPTAVTDIEMHAATQRLEAHRYHGAVLPVDGGRPVLPRHLALRAPAPKGPTRTRSTRTKTAAPRKPKKPDPPKRPVCPTCFLQLPLTGRCDNCDPD